MNRKRIALLTSLALISSTLINSTNPLRNTVIHEANAAQKKDLKPSKKYPDITKKLDIISMEQYSGDILFMNVTLNKFYVKDFARNDQGQTLLLLAPIKTSNQYFLITTEQIPSIQKNDQITVQGFLNGRIKIKKEQISWGLNSNLLNTKVVSMVVDNISLN